MPGPPTTTITVVLVCHNDVEMFKRKVEEILCWTRQPDELRIYSSFPFPKHRGIGTIVDPDCDDKGYRKTRRGMLTATKDWVVRVNYDDLHSWDFLKELEAATRPDSTVVHCEMAGKYAIGGIDGKKFVPYSSGAENFMVRTSIAKQLDPFADTKGYGAGNTSHPPDADFINAIRAEVHLDTIEYVPKVLVVVL